MSLQRFKASELTRFLVEIDKNLEEAARITIIGGSAAALGYNVSATQEAVGTKWYLAPEVVQGNYSVQGDVYGLGRTLECILTGKTPDNLEARKIPADDLRISLAAGEALDTVIAKATAPMPRDRYQSVSALIADLPELLIELAPSPESKVGVGEQSEQPLGLISDASLKEMLPLQPGDTLGVIDPERDGTHSRVIWKPEKGYSFLRLEAFGLGLMPHIGH